MSFQILPFTAESIPAVQDFNRRLAAAAIAPGQHFPETPEPGWLPAMQLFVAKDEDSVHGGYILRHQIFSVAGETVAAAHYRLPLSEGLIDRSYATLGLSMVRDALTRQPRLYALGMGGMDKPLPQMLKRLGWPVHPVPFYFKIVHPARFLRHIRPLRNTPLHRLAFDVTAFTGAGWLGMKLTGLARRIPAAPFDLEPSFSPWADNVWDRARSDYALLAVRDAATLDQLYPPSDPRFLRLRAAGGWAVLLDTQMHDHKQFGNMRVGTIVDCLAPPASAPAIIRAAASLLEQRGVDLVVSNQLHAAWARALRHTGFREAPTNYLFALSPAFAQSAAGASPDQFHINRGDGDGPIHL
jgi:hypothetical protein